jgi:hypothetical protein
VNCPSDKHFATSLVPKGVLVVLLVCGWGYLAQCQSYQNAPFDPSAPALPPAYYGYDPEAFVKGYEAAAIKAEESRQKGEFETTEEYQKRLKDLNSENPFTSGTYAFAIPPSSVSYDADSQTFNLEFKAEPASHNMTYVYLPLKHGAKDMGSYVAQNAFGAAFTVTRSLFFSYELWLAKGQGPTDCIKSVSVELAEAKALKANILALVIVRPLKPFASASKTFTHATFTDPREDTFETNTLYATSTEVRFYDARDGRVLASCP